MLDRTPLVNTKYVMRLSPLSHTDANSLKELLDIELKAAALGVELILSDRGGYIALQWIKRHGGRKGAGQRVMELLTDHADATGVPICLLVIGSTQLLNYYAEHGFVVDGGDSSEITMIRHPRAVDSAKKTHRLV